MPILIHWMSLVTYLCQLLNNSQKFTKSNPIQQNESQGTVLLVLLCQDEMGTVAGLTLKECTLLLPFK